MNWVRLVAAGWMLGTASILTAQDSQTPKPPSREQIERMTKAGPEHEKLSEWTGQWNLVVKMGGGQAAREFQGLAVNRMIVGGRFLEIDYRAQGKAEELKGMFHLGFDARHDRFSIIAMDSFGTYFVTSSGKRDETTGKIKMIGTDDDPMMKRMGLTKEFAHVFDRRGPDEFAIEVWFIDTRTPERREFKFMDYVFKRTTKSAVESP